MHHLPCLFCAVALLAAAVPAPADEPERLIHVDSVESLLRAIEQARPQTTIVVADGHYMLPRYVEVTADHVTIRSESGDRDAVIFDGAESRHRELIGVRDASHVTFADLTIQNVQANGLKVNNDTPVHHVTIRNCVIRNVWQRGVKAVRSPELKSSNGLIENCLFINDRPKRFDDDPSDTPETFGGNYIGAIDLMDAVDWTIRDNVFVDIQGRTRTGRGAIFIWFESEDVIIERNVIVDCDQGIAIGNAHITEETPRHAAGFIIRNNFISRAPMNAVFIGYTEDVAFIHNTIHDPENERGRSVRIFRDNPGLRMSRNLINGHPIGEEAVVGEIRVADNAVGTDMAELFRAPEDGDLRLTPSGIEALPEHRPLPDAPTDIDRNRRRAPTPPGAHHPQ